MKWWRTRHALLWGIGMVVPRWRYDSPTTADVEQIIQTPFIRARTVAIDRKYQYMHKKQGTNFSNAYKLAFFLTHIVVEIHEPTHPSNRTTFSTCTHPKTKHQRLTQTRLSDLVTQWSSLVELARKCNLRGDHHREHRSGGKMQALDTTKTRNAKNPHVSMKNHENYY